MGVAGGGGEEGEGGGEILTTYLIDQVLKL